jgi:hypothetical protein
MARNRMIEDKATSTSLDPSYIPPNYHEFHLMEQTELNNDLACNLICLRNKLSFSDEVEKM